MTEDSKRSQETVEPVAGFPQSTFADTEPGTGLDLTTCDREPIHIPGSIQSHGFLLLLDRHGRIEAASANTEEFLRLPLAEVFGQRLSGLFGEQRAKALLANLDSSELGTASRLLLTVPLAAGEVGAQNFEVVAHRISGDPEKTRGLRVRAGA